VFLLVKLKSSLRKFYSRHHDLVDRYGISCVTNDHRYVPLVNLPVLSSFMTYHRDITKLTRRVPQVEQELLTLPEHLFLLPVCSGVRVTRSLVLCVCFMDRCLSLFILSSCCLSFDLRNLITPLVSSNSSCESDDDMDDLIDRYISIYSLVCLDNVLYRNGSFYNICLKLRSVLCFLAVLL
jgi:hypothetical protein